jgi:DNA-binding CsgD family transcriptional regulator
MKASALTADRRQQGQAEAGIIHVDSEGEPCLPTEEAMRVLLYPQEVPENRKARQMVFKAIRAIFPAGPLAEETAPAGEFISGRRRYMYRIYRLGSAAGDGNELAAVIVIERYGQPLAPTADPVAPFHLTVREEQVLRGVLEGLSNKGIAERMGISPNTVKAFLRLIMTKLGVSNRFGILAKVMGRSVSRYRAGPPHSTPASAARVPMVRVL